MFCLLVLETELLEEIELSESELDVVLSSILCDAKFAVLELTVDLALFVLPEWHPDKTRVKDKGPLPLQDTYASSYTS